MADLERYQYKLTIRMNGQFLHVTHGVSDMVIAQAYPFEEDKIIQHLCREFAFTYPAGMGDAHYENKKED